MNLKSHAGPAGSRVTNAAGRRPRTVPEKDPCRIRRSTLKPRAHVLPRAVAAASAVLLALAPVLAAGPASAASAYTVHYLPLGNGTRALARWNPCRPHTYRVNLAAVPTRYKSAVLAETQSAMRAMGARTRMTFTYKGATTQVPKRSSSWAPPAQSAEIVIAYTTPARTNYPLAGATAGIGAEWESYGETSGAIIQGAVVIDTPEMLALYRAGSGPGNHRVNLLMHELGHVVGLGHVSNPRLLMNPTTSASTPYGFAAAELVGLARLGRASGCLNGW